MEEGDPQVPLIRQVLLQPTGNDHTAGGDVQQASLLFAFGGNGESQRLFGRVHTLYLYSHVIEYHIVGNSKAKVMGVFPVKGKHGEQQSWQFNPFQYIDIPTSTMSCITIRICFPTGEENPFLSGDNLWRLHFRRKML